MQSYTTACWDPSSQTDEACGPPSAELGWLLSIQTPTLIIGSHLIPQTMVIG